jgi:putative flippase GtrA
MNASPPPHGDLRRFVLFLIVGGINACFGYTAFAVLLWLGLGNDLSVILGNAMGIAFNFKTIGSVFSASGYSRLPHFLIIYGLLLPANVVMLRMLVAAGLGPYLGEALVIAVLAPISFLLMRRFVFLPMLEHRP